MVSDKKLETINMMVLTQITSKNEVQHEYFPLYYVISVRKNYIRSFIPLGARAYKLLTYLRSKTISDSKIQKESYKILNIILINVLTNVSGQLVYNDNSHVQVIVNKWDMCISRMRYWVRSHKVRRPGDYRRPTPP